MKFKALAASLAAAIGLSMIQAAPASAAEPDPGTANKIDSSLTDRFRTEPASDFWITFDTKADLGPAKKITDWTARGRFVYDALTAAAKNSLASVSTELDRAGVKYTSYPIANTVLVKGAPSNSPSTWPRRCRSPRSTRRRRSPWSSPWTRRARLTRLPAPPARRPLRQAPPPGVWTPSAPPRRGPWAAPVRASPCPTSTRACNSTTPP
ncbi:hypothetical protein ACFQZ4_34730 [Catellatospora coxensis]